MLADQRRLRPLPHTSPSEVQRNLLLSTAYPHSAHPALINALSNTLAAHPSLTLSVAPYLSLALLRLSGTIPTAFRGATYNLPLQILLLPDHPHGPPHVFLNPSPTMAPVPHPHVAPDLRVHIPDLASWTPASSLIRLIAKLSAIFSHKPPLLSRLPPPSSPTQLATLTARKALLSRTRAALETTSTLARQTYTTLAARHESLSSQNTTLTTALLSTSTASHHALTVLDQTLTSRRALDALAADLDFSTDLSPASLAPPDALTARITACVADDLACQDGLAAGADALAAGRLALDHYMADVRRLAKRMFCARDAKLVARHRQALEGRRVGVAGGL